MRRATLQRQLFEANSYISIHALLAESDRKYSQSQECYFYFYPRSPCGERQMAGCWPVCPAPISIHALLAESDKTGILLGLTLHEFLSTLSLRRATSNGGTHYSYIRFLSTLSLRRATRRTGLTCGGGRFLSTLSLRRATWLYCTPLSTYCHFYPRSPCGERQPDGTTTATFFGISIHALLAESDRKLKSFV